jgi:hypothetical protein
VSIRVVIAASREAENGALTVFSFSIIFTVVSQLTHASVMLTPCLRFFAPVSGTSCRPSLMFDSIMTPVMLRSPAASCSQIESMTRGWLL